MQRGEKIRVAVVVSRGAKPCLSKAGREEEREEKERKGGEWRAVCSKRVSLDFNGDPSSRDSRLYPYVRAWLWFGGHFRS